MSKQARKSQQKVAFSLLDLTEMLGISRSKLYNEVQEGRLRLSKIGARSIVLAGDLADYLEALRQDPS